MWTNLSCFLIGWLSDQPDQITVIGCYINSTLVCKQKFLIVIECDIIELQQQVKLCLLDFLVCQWESVMQKPEARVWFHAVANLCMCVYIKMTLCHKMFFFFFITPTSSQLKSHQLQLAMTAQQFISGGFVL